MKEFITCYQQKNVEALIPLGRSILEKRPDDLEVMFGLANSYIDIDSLKQATILCNKILETDSNFYNAYYLLGVIYQIDTNYIEAKKYYLKVISMHPTYARAYLNLGKIYEEIGNKRDAIACYLNAINLFINNQFYDEVNEWCYHVLQLDSTNSTAYTYWAKLFIDKNEYEKATEMLQESINSNPFDAFAYLTLGKMCYDLGEYKHVELFFEQAIKYDSIYKIQEFANQMDIELMAYLYLMDYYKATNDTIKCREAFHKAWIKDEQAVKYYINDQKKSQENEE